tara:strand:+ start:90 stop:1463 length:1374 start_codon:yes stop_codon:yes gene_type:complete
MADLNALIAQGAQFQAPPDPFVQYGRMQQLEQGQQTNQLNRMKMQEAQRSMEETNALRRLDPASETYLQDVTRISPEKGFAFAKSQREAKNADTEGQIKNTKLIADKLALLPDAYRRADTPEAYLEVHKSVHADPVLGPYLRSLGATPEKGLAQLEEAVRTGKFPQLRMGSMQSVSQLLDSVKPVVVAPGASVYQGGAFSQAPAAPDKAPAPPSMVAEFNFAKTPEGGNFRGDYQQFVTARAAAGRAPAAPRPEQPPVAVVDPVTGKPVYVTREQALSGKMTPASAMESLPPKEIQARESKFPAATSAVKTFESSAEKLAIDLERLATHPGLSGISGLVYGRTPAITKDARAAQALYDSIVARGGFQELQNMRASSPTGGALGNVSNQEGQYLRDAFAPINRTQDTADLSRSLKDAAVAARTSKQRVRDAYDMTYEYKTGGSAAPQGSGGFKYLGKE